MAHPVSVRLASELGGEVRNAQVPMFHAPVAPVVFLVHDRATLYEPLRGSGELRLVALQPEDEVRASLPEERRVFARGVQSVGGDDHPGDVEALEQRAEACYLRTHSAAEPKPTRATQQPSCSAT